MATSKVISLALFTLLAGMVSVVSGWKVELIANNTSVLGGETTIKCLYDKEDTQNVFSNSLTIESKENGGETLLVDYGFARQLLSKEPDDPRYSFNITTLTLTISPVTCSDKKTFICKISASVLGSGSITKEKQFDLDIKVPPEAPDAITTTPSNLTGGVLENNQVSATCNAITGRQGKGYIEWRIYRASVAETLNKDDDMITNSVISSGSGTDPACAVRQRSILTLPPLTAQDQNLVLACFVRSDDFASPSPQNCDSSQASLCQQTETIRVLYSVREVRASREPQSEIPRGESVTLTCTASGFPAPTYSWSKVGDNRTLVNGDKSRMVLTNLDIENDSGDYNCTATNTIGGTSFYESAQVKVTVVEPPPTTPTTEPKPTTNGGNGNTGGNKGASADKSSDDDEVTIIVVVVVVVVAVVIAAVAGFFIWRKRKGTKEDPPQPKENPFYNNKQALGSSGGTLNNSFHGDNGDGLMYADLTYDNQPRSRKPMAIGDAASDYSDVQMPQV